MRLPALPRRKPSTRIDVARSRVRVRDVIVESCQNVSRSPLRTALTAMGTVLAVATAVATVGMAQSASDAVSGTFNRLNATSVTFSDNDPRRQPDVFDEGAVASLSRLHGVVSAGLIWNLGAGSALTVSRTRAPTGGQGSAGLSVAAASPGALTTLDVIRSDGRLYDEGMDRRRARVALLSQNAARSLGIDSVALSPAIYIAGVRFTAIGIVDVNSMSDESVTGVIVPPGAAAAITAAAGSSDGPPAREIIVRTTSGAAQLIGRQGPYAIDPYEPGRVNAAVPIDPAQLRDQVSGQLTALLLAVAGVTLLVGVFSITNITFLAVAQRRFEIGLRRSLGASPLHIATLILIEALVVGGLGGLLGTSVGVIATAALSAGRGWAPTLSPVILLLAPLVGCGSGLLAGMYPAWRASRISPLSALQG
jgi:putative ABC transport system permease protein